MATQHNSYDHPNYTTINQESKTATITATGTQHGLTFRSRVAAVVTGIYAIVGVVATGTLILTLLIDGSVAAILTLQNSINEGGQAFTLSVNRTLTALTSRIEMGTPTHASGTVSVVYEYRVVPGATYSLFAAIS